MGQACCNEGAGQGVQVTSPCSVSKSSVIGREKGEVRGSIQDFLLGGVHSLFFCHFC